MKVTRFHVPTEVRRALEGKRTKVSLESLFYNIAPQYLKAVKLAEGQADEAKAIAELERIFRLEDPRI